MYFYTMPLENSAVRSLLDNGCLHLLLDFRCTRFGIRTLGARLGGADGGPIRTAQKTPHAGFDVTL